MTEEIQKDPKLQNQVFLLFVDRIMDTVDKVISQFTSGRWILTVAAAYIIVYVSLKDVAYVKEFKEIIAVIIYAYFQRGDRQTEKPTTGEKVNETKIISNAGTINTSDSSKS